VLGQVPNSFLAFSKAVGRDHHPDGDLLYQQAAPVMRALQTLDTAFVHGSAPGRIANDMGVLVLADQRLLDDMTHLPGLSGSRLGAWEQAFSSDGGTEQTAFNNVLHDFGLPSVGHAP
jgi:hypothetical protein